ncbi:MAG: hypothetical protein R3C40_03915 [Parvularculaceae bacterium]|nr:hypothetical protein [Parvularculaceae bacterium]
MKSAYLLGAAAAASALGLAGLELRPPQSEGAPFINPLTLVRSACGNDPAAAMKRRMYFARIGAAYAATLDDDATTAPMIRMQPVNGIGYEITTDSDAAQALFDAGIAHMWNFNHDEAINAFRSAQEKDPQCAMCYWAEAFAWGPNINAPMAPEAMAPAYIAAQKAVDLKDGASEKENMLIDALALRYVSEPGDDRSALDAAFADAMDGVVAQYPDDDFIAALSAEANMDTQPWDYWNADGRTPKGRAGKTLSLLEAVLARNPDYQPAIHLYIHTTEATSNPYRAVEYADKLADLSPRLGHLIHMPSHTYARVGMHEESIDSNIKAVAADEAYIASADASPIYEFGYYVHNVHFLMTSAQMAGDSETALAMALKLDAKLPAEMAFAAPFSQPIKVAPYFAMVQYADPDDILMLAAPDDGAPFIKAAWHYARGEALARKGDTQGAREQAEAISQILATADLSGLVDNLIPAVEILKIEQLTVLARAAAADGDLSTAINAMEEVVALQDGLNYTEPPYWYYPARQTLAAMALRNGEAERAEHLFLEALTETPNNGWAYFGLAETYAAQGDANARKYAQSLMKSSWIGKTKPALEDL